MGRSSRGWGLFERRGGYAPDEELPPERFPRDLYAAPPRDEVPANPPSPDED